MSIETNNFRLVFIILEINYSIILRRMFLFLHVPEIKRTIKIMIDVSRIIVVMKGKKMHLDNHQNCFRNNIHVFFVLKHPSYASHRSKKNLRPII